MTEGDAGATGHSRPAAGQPVTPDRPITGYAEPSYLPLAEVAALKGMHPEALRSLVRRDQVPARRDNRGKWLVAVPAGYQEHQPADDRSVTGQDDALAELKSEVSDLRTELARVRARLGAAEDVARAGLEARDLVNAELRRSLEREQARADRLEAEARRPWWRRLVG